MTEEKEEKELKAAEEKIIKEEQLRQLTYSDELYKALKLSLDLNRKNDFISILKKIINKKLKEDINNTANNSYMDHIQMIIENRKKLQELSDESNDMNLALNENADTNQAFGLSNASSANDTSNAEYKKKLQKLILDRDLAKIILEPERFHLVLEVVRDNNVKSSSFFLVQILLKMILIRKNYEEYFNKNKESNIGLKNKGFKKTKKNLQEIKNIDYMENFEIIKAYSEKHYERINREITKAYLIDFVLDKMKIV